MSNAASLKQQIINSFIQHRSIELDYEQANKEIWFNYKDQGLRLSKLGYEFCCKELKLSHYTTEYDVEYFVPAILLGLSRKLTAPYYIIHGNISRPCKLVLFSQEDHVLLTLVNANIMRFLDLK